MADKMVDPVRDTVIEKALHIEVLMREIADTIQTIEGKDFRTEASCALASCMIINLNGILTMMQAFQGEEKDLSVEEFTKQFPH